MIGNAWKHRPERQARLQQDMQNPEWRRRREIYRKARGKVLGHFNKKQLVTEWNLDWNQSGRSPDHPDFPEWLKLNRERLIKRRDEDRAAQARINKAHADWVARGMPLETA